MVSLKNLKLDVSVFVLHGAFVEGGSSVAWQRADRQAGRRVHRHGSVHFTRAFGAGYGPVHLTRVPLGQRVGYHSLRSRGRRVHRYGPVHLARVLGAGGMVP